MITITGLQKQNKTPTPKKKSQTIKLYTSPPRPPPPNKNTTTQNLTRIMVYHAEQGVHFLCYLFYVLGHLVSSTVYQPASYLLYSTTKCNRTVNAPLMLRCTGGKKSHTHIHVPKILVLCVTLATFPLNYDCYSSIFLYRSVY